MLGWGEDLGDGCLGLDSGLAPYLRGEHDPATLDRLRARWADAATTALTDSSTSRSSRRRAGWPGSPSGCCPSCSRCWTGPPPTSSPSRSSRSPRGSKAWYGTWGSAGHSPAPPAPAPRPARLGAWSHARYHRAIAQRIPEQSAATRHPPRTGHPPRITALVHALQAPPPTQCTRTRHRAARCWTAPHRCRSPGPQAVLRGQDAARPAEALLRRAGLQVFGNRLPPKLAHQHPVGDTRTHVRPDEWLRRPRDRL